MLLIPPLWSWQDCLFQSNNKTSCNPPLGPVAEKTTIYESYVWKPISYFSSSIDMTKTNLGIVTKFLDILRLVQLETIGLFGLLQQQSPYPCSRNSVNLPYKAIITLKILAPLALLKTYSLTLTQSYCECTESMHNINDFIHMQTTGSTCTLHSLFERLR